MRRIRSEGYTVLIVEQNVSQVLKMVDRAYLLRSAASTAERQGTARGACFASDDVAQGVSWGCMADGRMHWGEDCQLDIFFLEAIINGLLLAGLLALLALGLNLVFGVIDVVWICYAELVMVGMYGINYAYKGGMPFLLAALFGILLVALAGAVLHQLVIRPVLEFRADQSASGHRRRAVLPAGRRHHDVRHRFQEPRHPARLDRVRRHVVRLVAHPRLRRRARRHAGTVAVPQPHLHRHRDPRHLAGPPDHAADGRRQPQASISSPRRSAAALPGSRRR